MCNWLSVPSPLLILTAIFFLFFFSTRVDPICLLHFVLPVSSPSLFFPSYLIFFFTPLPPFPSFYPIPLSLNSIIKRYTEGVFNPKYKLTIGVDFAVKTVDWDPETRISLQLWDVAGHERYGSMTRVYYKYAIAAVIVFDLSRPVTFEAVRKWRQDLNSKVTLSNGEPIPALLLGNKCDLPGIKINREELDAYAVANNYIGWFETSAQDDVNIDKAMKLLISKLLEVAATNEMPARDPDVLKFSTEEYLNRGAAATQATQDDSCCSLNF